MELTYNQIIKTLNDFATSHYQINEFGNGDLWEVIQHDQQKDFNYPLLWVQDQPNTTTQGEIEMVFRCFFINLVQKDESNENEVKSDMHQCCLDLLAFWKKQTDYRLVSIDVNTSLTSFTERFNDELTGWWIDIKLNQQFNYDKCSIPMDGITPIPSNCLPATITINGASFTTAASGATEDIIVKDTDGTSVGSKIGVEWIVPALTPCDPVSNSMNGAALTDAAAGTTKTFVITYADASAVTVTETSDSATAFVGTVPNAATDIIYVRDFWQAGDDVVAVNGSMAWYKANTTIFDDNQPASGLAVKLDPDDDTKLTTLNAFGNLNRVTNDKGASNYADVGGGLTSDGATANLAVDNYTGTFVLLNALHAGTESWDDSVVTAQAATFARYDGTTYNQLQMIPPKLVQHYLTGTGMNSHIFSGIDNWNDLVHWIMGVSTGLGTSCYFWRENQPWSATNIFNSFSRSTVNSGIDLIVWGNIEDYA